MSGFSFKIGDASGGRSSGWLGADRLFTTPEFLRRYPTVDISLFTPKVTLVPEAFFIPAQARAALSDVVTLRPTDTVEYVPVPAWSAVLVFSNTIDESLSRVVSQTVLTESGMQAPVLPELYYLLTGLLSLQEYNKILASYADGCLYLAIAQGRSLQMANVFRAPDFTTAEYFLFLALKQLQLNPEVSTVVFRTPLRPEDEMSLYRYFKGVVQV